MFLLSIVDQLTMLYEKSAGQNLVQFEPFRPYVLSDSQFKKFEEDPHARSVFFKTSKLAPYIRNFNAATEKPGRLFFYTGGGGYGDQILAWPVVKYLSKMGYQVDVFADPGNESCWWMQEWVRSVSTIPILKTTFDNYRQVCIFEEVTNMDEHMDQGHPVDVMFKKIGLDPMAVAPEDKVVAPKFTPSERNRALALLHTLGIPQFKRFAITQFAASVKLRSFTPDETVGYLSALAKAHPDIAWINLVDKYNDSAYKIRIQESGIPNVFAYTFPALRDCWAAIMRASVVVGVDSMVVHVAGSASIPAVGMWGPVHPVVRTKYYKNHLPLFASDVCQYAPCFFASGTTLPHYCPPRNPPAMSCQVMQAITPEKLVDAVSGIIVNNRP